MHKSAQAWFTGGPSSDLDKKAPSLLDDWNAYAAASDPSDTDSSSFDLEAAVRTANNRVFSTFSVVSKGVRELPGSFNNATSSVPSGKSLMYFGIFIATGVFFIFIAFTIFLPVMVLKPQKFALCFTIGCAFIICSFFALKGPKYQLNHMLSKERLPFTLGFIGSTAGTIYVSMVLHSYILSVFFSVLQGSYIGLGARLRIAVNMTCEQCIIENVIKVLALLYYAISYFPGGSAGLKLLSSALTSSAMRCFGR